MKKLSYFVILFITIFVGTICVNAGTIECKNPVGTGEQVTCDVKATFEGSLTNIAITGEGVTATPITTNVEGGENVKIGTISFTAQDTSGTKSISLDISGTYVDTEESFTDTATTSVQIKSKDTTIAKITVDGKEVTNKKITVDKDTVVVEATGASNVSITAGNGTKKLSCGDNTVAITAKSEYGTSATTNITITRTCDATKTLKGIKVSAKKDDNTSASVNLSPSFSPNTLGYKVDVDSDVTKFTISVTKANQKQKVEGEFSDKALAYGENKFAIKVTSEKGETNTYNIVVNRKDDRGTSASLKSIKLSAGKIDFSSGSLDYETKVLYEVTKIDVKAVPTDEKAKVEISGNTNLKVGENTITIKVTSEDEKETRDYKIVVNRLKEGEVLGDNPYIKSLKIKGYEIDFDREDFNYKVKIKKDKALKFTVVMEEEGATYKVINNSSLEDGSIIKIITKSLDGEESLTYKIEIEKEGNILIYLIIGLSLIAAIALIIFFVARSKKKKNSSDFDDEKDVREDLDKTIEYKSEEADDIKQAVNSIPANEDILVKINEMNSRPRTAREDLKKVQDEDSDIDIYSSILQGSTVKRLRSEQDKIEEVQEQKTRQSSKVCSICGHRVPATAEMCPYCKRVF